MNYALIIVIPCQYIYLVVYSFYYFQILCNILLVTKTQVYHHMNVTIYSIDALDINNTLIIVISCQFSYLIAYSFRDIAKHELELWVASYELRAESLKAQVEVQKCEFKSTSYKFESTSYEFESTSYELKFTSYEFNSTSYEFKSTSYEFKSTSNEIKSTSYEFKSTSYEFESTSYEFESTSSRIIY